MDLPENLLAKKFLFSPLSKQDLKFFNEVRNSASKYLHDQRTFSLEDTKLWFEDKPPANYWLVKFDNQSIGYFRTKEPGNLTWEVGADLHESYRGRGLAKSMYQTFAQKVLAPNGVSRCSLRVLRSNLRAIHLYKTLGFQVTAETYRDFAMEIDVLKLCLPELPMGTQS